MKNIKPKVYPIRIFIGKYISRVFEQINGESILVLEVKEGSQKLRIECPDGYSKVFPNGLTDNAEYEWIIEEKIRNKVSYKMRKLTGYKLNMSEKEVKDFYKSINHITYEIKREGKPDISIKEANPSTPYERVSVRTTYYELVIKDVSKIKGKLS